MTIMCRILGPKHVVFRPLDDTPYENRLRKEVLQDPKFHGAEVREVLVTQKPYPRLGVCYELR